MMMWVLFRVPTVYTHITLTTHFVKMCCCGYSKQHPQHHTITHFVKMCCCGYSKQHPQHHTTIHFVKMCCCGYSKQHPQHHICCCVSPKKDEHLMVSARYICICRCNRLRCPLARLSSLQTSPQWRHILYNKENNEQPVFHVWATMQQNKHFGLFWVALGIQ